MLVQVLELVLKPGAIAKCQSQVQVPEPSASARVECLCESHVLVPVQVPEPSVCDTALADVL